MPLALKAMISLFLLRTPRVTRTETESAEGSELIDGIGNEEDEIFDDDHEGDIVAANVFGEFEESEVFGTGRGMRP